jgi:hypothetical protein
MQPLDPHACSTNQGGIEHVQDGSSECFPIAWLSLTATGNGGSRIVKGLYPLLLIPICGATSRDLIGYATRFNQKMDDSLHGGSLRAVLRSHRFIRMYLRGGTHHLGV